MDIKTRSRFKAAGIASLDSGLSVGLLFLFAYHGIIAFDAAVKVFWCATLVAIVGLTAIASGWSKRLADPSITQPQIIGGLGLNLYALWLAPQIGYMFVLNFFVALAYGSLHLSLRQFVNLGLCAALIVTFLALGDFSGVAMISSIERQLFLFVLLLALTRFTIVNGAVSTLRRRLHLKNKEQVALMERLSFLATHDELTGLCNRRYYMDQLANETQRAGRNGHAFCVAIIDADHFKRINDTYGHHVGDEVLRELAAVLTDSVRATGCLARYGGEEFVMLMIDTVAVQAQHSLERLRQVVSGHAWQCLPPGINMTISIGLAQWEPPLTPSVLLAHADLALYDAKGGGRNAVSLWREPPHQP